MSDPTEVRVILNGQHEVVLVRYLGNHFATVRDPDTGSEWDVMANRLEPMDVKPERAGEEETK